MLCWWIDNKGIQIQITLQVLSIESAMGIEEHFQQAVYAIDGIQGVLTVG